MASAERCPSPGPPLSLIVSLQTVFEVHQCGGTLVAEDWILTSAQCLDPLPVYAKFGLRDLGADINDINGDAYGVRYLNCVLGRRVTGMVRHPGYNWRTLENDVALLRVASLSRVEMASAFVPLVALAGARANFTAPEYVSAGWGAEGYISGANADVAAVARFSPAAAAVSDPILQLLVRQQGPRRDALRVGCERSGGVPRRQRRRAVPALRRHDAPRSRRELGPWLPYERPDGDHLHPHQRLPRMDVPRGWSGVRAAAGATGTAAAARVHSCSFAPVSRLRTVEGRTREAGGARATRRALRCHRPVVGIRGLFSAADHEQGGRHGGGRRPRVRRRARLRLRAQSPAAGGRALIGAGRWRKPELGRGADARSNMISLTSVPQTRTIVPFSLSHDSTGLAASLPPPLPVPLHLEAAITCLDRGLTSSSRAGARRARRPGAPPALRTAPLVAAGRGGRR